MGSAPAGVTTLATASAVGWRPEWRAPKKHQRARAREAAQAIAREPLPSSAELGDEALRILRAVAIDVSAPSVARVQAAKALLEATAPDVREHMLKLLKGDRDKFKAWLLAELHELERNSGGLPDRTTRPRYTLSARDMLVTLSTQIA